MIRIIVSISLVSPLLSRSLFYFNVVFKLDLFFTLDLDFAISRVSGTEFSFSQREDPTRLCGLSYRGKMSICRIDGTDQKLSREYIRCTDRTISYPCGDCTPRIAFFFLKEPSTRHIHTHAHIYEHVNSANVYIGNLLIVLDVALNG